MSQRRLSRLPWVARSVRVYGSTARAHPPAKAKRRCTTRSSMAGLADLLQRICHRSVAKTVTVTRHTTTTMYRHVALLPALCSKDLSRPQKIGPATVVCRPCQDVLVWKLGCQVHRGRVETDVYLYPTLRHHRPDVETGQRRYRSAYREGQGRRCSGYNSFVLLLLLLQPPPPPPAPASWGLPACVHLAPVGTARTGWLPAAVGLHSINKPPRPTPPGPFSKSSLSSPAK